MRCYKCIEEAMQQSWYRQKQFPFPTSVEIQVAEELDSRLGIFITATSTQPYWIRNQSIGNIQGGIGLGGVGSGQGYFGATVRDFGGMVKAQWYAVQTVAGGTTIWVAECVGPPMTDANSYEDSVSW
jgi:hypothetical protein